MISKNIAILFGSYNPPHIGHITIINSVLNNYLADKIILFVSGSYHLDKRVSMARQLVKEFFIREKGKFNILSKKDINPKKEIEPLDIVKFIKENYKYENLFYIIGNNKEIELRKELAALEENGANVRVINSTSNKYRSLEIKNNIPFSKEIRKLILEGKEITSFVPSKIAKKFLKYNYIIEDSDKWFLKDSKNEKNI